MWEWFLGLFGGSEPAEGFEGPPYHPEEYSMPGLWDTVTGFIGDLFGWGGKDEAPATTTVVIEPPNLTPMYLLFGGFGAIVIIIILVIAFKK